jgi:hypothetical protein
MARKATTEELQYLRKDQGFKASKDELEVFKQEVAERLQTLSLRVTEKDKYLNVVLEETEAKIAEMFSDLRTKVNQRLEEQAQNKSRELMSRVVVLSEQLQEY